jgi:peptidoglycan/xylan/chitin deacetylase (PgdA/CDA1 family)
MTRDEEEAGLVRANEQIRKLTGRTARGYRSPSWDLSKHSVELLLKHGFVYDSSMMGDDYTPYRVRQGDVIRVDEPAVWGKPCRLIEMPISWSLDDYPHFEFMRTKEWIMPGLRNYNAVLANWIDDFTYMTKTLKWGVITYTFHPFVIGRAGRMLLLEKLIRKLRDGGAIFTTLEDAATEYAKRTPFKS